MGEDTFRSMVVGSIFIVLFSALLLMFMTTMANSNGVDTTYFDEDILNFTQLNDSLTGVQGESEKWRKSFSEQNIFSAIAGIVVTTVFGISLKMLSFIVNMFDLLFFQLLENVLGIPAIVTGSLLAVVIIYAIFGIWRWLKVGD